MWLLIKLPVYSVLYDIKNFACVLFIRNAPFIKCDLNLIINSWSDDLITSNGRSEPKIVDISTPRIIKKKYKYKI